MLLGCLLAALAACSGKAESTAPGGDDDAAKAEPIAEDKDWGGWQWKGQRDDCFFKVDNACFASLAAACKKAGCKGAACEHDKSAPANVSCKD